MLREVAKALLVRMGYQLGRYQPGANAFSEMHRLSQRIANPVIFDVGAYHGLVSLQLRRLFPTSRVYAFEPFPSSYRRLIESTASDPMIEAFNVGLSDVSGFQCFSSNASSATNSLLETDEEAANVWGPFNPWYQTDKRVSLKFETVDDFVENRDITSIDILKLDVQGAEYRILNGAERTIAEKKITMIYAEIITAPAYRGQKEVDQVLGMYRDYGFALHNIYNPVLVEGRLCQVDALFVQANDTRGMQRKRSGASP